MTPFTLVLPYYRNAGMLREQRAIWRTFPKELRACMHAIVVDDGSPKQRALDALDGSEDPGLASFRLYRIGPDVRWNWLACRNLGMAEAETNWVLMTDMDHVLSLPALRRIVEGPLGTELVYRFSRADAPHPWPYKLSHCRPYKIHPNTWLMTRGMFDRVGGYDERLSGCYGTDGEFRDRVQQHARAVVVLEEVLLRYPREVVPDASTVGLTRKNDPRNDEDLRQRRIAREVVPGWRPLRGTFQWERQL